ncbi:hypothetical protein [Dietzia cinnamea]|nr:hypothetical protein [Dietzia cinnamea]
MTRATVDFPAPETPMTTMCGPGVWPDPPAAELLVVVTTSRGLRW